MFDSKSSESVPLTGIHRLLKYLISDEDDESDETFHHMKCEGLH